VDERQEVKTEVMIKRARSVGRLVLARDDRSKGFKVETRGFMP